MIEETNNLPVVLCILDGLGLGKANTKNAFNEACTPNIDKLFYNFPNSEISASGLDVGLPSNQVGNSEVGHMAIGSGRIINNDLVRIEDTIRENLIIKNKFVKEFSKKLLKSNGKVHLLGLLSDGGVHSKSKHILELAKVFVSKGLKVVLHIFTDGRDTLPKISHKIIEKFIKRLPEQVEIGTVIGRFYSMDRDNRWERIHLSWKAIVMSESKYKGKNALDAVLKAYERNETDEFIYPTILEDKNGDIYNGVFDGDGIVSANFRADRMRQILSSIIDNNFNEFYRSRVPKLSANLGMIQYSEKLKKLMQSIFPVQVPKNTLSEIISNNRLKQLKIAETEKYPHVTFFLNGGVEKKYFGEDRILIPSPKVLTYDTAPKMSALEIKKTTLNAIIKKKHNLIVVNFANPDMVGHTGNFEAVKEALEFLDDCVGEIVELILKVKGVMLLTSDHGNCEVMWDESNNSPHTAHTNNKVPLILIGYKEKVNLLSGRLQDIAPTILSLLKIKKPNNMTGKTLII